MDDPLDDMEKSGGARRTLRIRASTANSVQSAPTTSAEKVAPSTPGSESPKSEVNDGRGSRSSRLNNPEFAAKHKAFMAKVTAATKGSMDTYLTSEIISNLANTGKRKLHQKGDEPSTKRRRSTRTNSSGLDVQNDGYCWICHKEGDFICCETCPRVFHHKCIQLEDSPAEDWVCPECVLIMTAENMETRSRAMRLLTIDQLCTLLKHALTRMKSVNNIDPFLKPVDPQQFPAYKDYISCPMDIQSMERNIRRKQYGSTEAMLADCKWIVHNCIIFNSPSSKLTSIAKSIVKVCRHEMQEIENCPDCYLNAHVKKDVWFVEACRLPHPLVWAKLKGFPYWPGKMMRVNHEGNADIRFFGAHDRAWIPMKDVFLFSKKPPSDIKKKRGNIDTCFHEVEKHLKKLKDRFGKVEYADHKMQYDHTREADMLKILFPNFKPPFDIGKIGRRNRSYSFTGSEKSRDATPTPSDAGPFDDECEELANEHPPPKDLEQANSKVLTTIDSKEKIKHTIGETERDFQPEEAIKPTLLEDSKEQIDSVNQIVEGKHRDAQVDESSVKVDENTQTAVIADNNIGLESSSLEEDGVNSDNGLQLKDSSSTYEIESNKIPSQLNPISDILASTKTRKEEIKTIEVSKSSSSEEVSLQCTTEKATVKSDKCEMAEANEVNKIVSRHATSPPCEVSSTTAIPGSQENTLQNTQKTVEGVIEDDNDGKVVIEDNEIDDSEPVNTDGLEEKGVVEETNEKDIGDIAPTASLVIEANIEETGTKSNHSAIDSSPGSGMQSNINEESIEDSATSLKTTGKDLDNRISNRGDEGDLPKNKEKNLSQDNERSNSNALLAISKAPLQQPARKSNTPINSNDADVRSRGANHAGKHPSHSPSFFTPRLPGHRVNQPMGPAGVQMMSPMVPSPGQGMMLRGQFRGPGLPPRPPRPSHPHCPLALPPSLPSSAGRVAQQLNKVAAKLAESLKQNLGETFADVTEQENPEAVIKRLQLECEKLQWRHQQELAEVKHNADLVIMEMRQAMDQEKQKALIDVRKQADLDKQKAILEMKKKQWCAHCGNEAIFYCCWNTSYCDYPCQQAHWPTHMSTCTQNNVEEDLQSISQPEPIPQQPQYMHHLPPGPGMRIPHHTRFPAGIAQMRFGVRQNLPRHMHYTRPYYM